MKLIIKVIFLTIIINLVNFLERRMKKNNFRYLLRPILIAPLGGWILGNLSTGINIGLLLELIWGSNLFNYDFGLQYVNLTAILTVILTLLTGNISFVVILTFTLIISYVLQELINSFNTERYSWLLEIGIFLFIFTILNFAPILKEFLGSIPAQFLDKLARAAGLLPSLGLGVILAQAIISGEARGQVKNTYLLALLSTLFFSLKFIYLTPLFFLIAWGLFYVILNRVWVSKQFISFIVGGLVIIGTPFLVMITGSLVDSQLKLVLWSEAFLSLSTLLLLFFNTTQFEIYFLILIIGVSLGKAGLIL
ncbi:MULTISPECIES: hypothetical protein [unclassified Candidatus Frackibacter]|uniref:hypothetical protein n=1 Tax=unclassified Candidatus Frackibacter TaxID=2648818 RepID=UPI0008AB0943|nr:MULTISPECIES: hypothetical protein [unclassified Candidatus Frackibacter]SEM84935.1 PTS system, mannose-specific IIC component [Candidatus Frackibacter sp. WG12]SFL94188.1 PTS system, mannose-specific IIC component [Candidatus Frackibacter sp. WG13]